MSKTDLRARPIFRRTRDAIEAHLPVVFTALAVARFMQVATGLSLKKIITTLRPLREFVGEIDGHKLVFPPQVPPSAAELVSNVENYGAGPDAKVKQLWSVFPGLLLSHGPGNLGGTSPMHCRWPACCWTDLRSWTVGGNGPRSDKVWSLPPLLRRLSMPRCRGNLGHHPESTLMQSVRNDSEAADIAAVSDAQRAVSSAVYSAMASF